MEWRGEVLGWGGEALGWGEEVLGWGGEVLGWGGEVLGWGGDVGIGREDYCVMVEVWSSGRCGCNEGCV